MVLIYDIEYWLGCITMIVPRGTTIRYFILWIYTYMSLLQFPNHKK